MSQYVSCRNMSATSTSFSLAQHVSQLVLNQHVLNVLLSRPPVRACVCLFRSLPHSLPPSVRPSLPRSLGGVHTD